MSREHHSKTKLVYYNSGIRPNLYAWGHLEAHPEWTIPGLNTERALKKWTYHMASAAVLCNIILKPMMILKGP